MFKLSYILLALLASLAPEFFVHAQQPDQSGFISLDCGLPRNSNYTEPTTGLIYISDAAFIDTGTSRSISPENKPDRQEQVKLLRSFPDGRRNCYKINVTARTRYLIRATFFHGNYDGLSIAPEFDLHLGGNFWSTVSLLNVSLSALREILLIPLEDYVHVCLVNTGNGTPFISALELRPMTDAVYYNNTGSVESLLLDFRFDVGSNIMYRFPYDVIDRAWLPYMPDFWNQTTTPGTIDPNSTNKYRPPSVVMTTGATPANESLPMEFLVVAPDTRTTFYYYLHFAELKKLEAGEYRAFNVTVNGETAYDFLAPKYLRTTTIYNTNGLTGSMNYTFSINRVGNSTLPPVLNGVEFFTIADFSQQGTEVEDVDAITEVKSSYRINGRNWDGDPCVPKDYLWTGVNCSYNGFDPPRITALNLSSSGLTGVISSDIAKLSMLQTLDLSNNNLTGSVPGFLSEMPNLRVINLARNNLTGSVPDELLEKAKSGALSLSIGENQGLCDSSEQCDTSPVEKKSNSVVIPVVASVAGVVVLLLVVAAIFVGFKKKNKRQEPKPKTDSFMSNKRRFTYSEIQRITDNFEKTLGKGGFGTVYHGFIDKDTQVAVKMLSSTSEQGYQQFQAEVQLLMKVYHGNLTNLVGYCNEGTYLALVYELMANGDLSSHLSGDGSESALSWEVRLQIATDVAQGLEYLHCGCKPAIIHRDVKPANILLGEHFHAKLADFGLSRSFASSDTASYVVTAVAGSPGYLDPAYSATNMLNEKSDVYSFGVVLLVIITRKPAIIISRTERIHVSQWVSSILRNGVISSIVDAGLQGDYDTNSAWKAVELGMACVSPAPAKRPNMSEVVSVLKECFTAELSRKNRSSTAAESALGSNSLLNLDETPTEYRPLAR